MLNILFLKKLESKLIKTTEMSHTVGVFQVRLNKSVLFYSYLFHIFPGSMKVAA